MTQTIKLKRSSVPNKVPVVDQLDFGELAINVHDGKIYLKRDFETNGEEIVEIANTLNFEEDFNAKVDKVDAPVVGNFASLLANGNIEDSGLNSTSFATVAQGALAQSALQPGNKISLLTNDAGYITDGLQPGDDISLLDNNLGFISGITNESIGDLNDIDLDGIQTGQILKWSGTEFIPGDDNGGGAGIPEAPINDTLYGRINGFWAKAANATQGDKADSALQPNDNVSALLNDAGYLTADDIPTDSVTSVDGRTGVVTLTDLYAPIIHTHVKADITDFSDADYATSGQGTLADSALQPNDNVSALLNDAGYITDGLQPGDDVSELVNDAGYITNITNSSIDDLTDVSIADISTGQILEWDGSTFIAGDKGSGGAVDSVDGRTGVVTLTDLYATSAQGTLADSAVQAGDNISDLTNDAGYITDADAGEVNTARNIGTGTGVYSAKVSEELQFKTLIAGDNVTLDVASTEITINADGAGIEEAPIDGNQYARQNGGWSEVESTGGGGSTFESARINYNAFGTILSVNETTSGISSTSIDGAQYINFDFSYNRPPASIVFYAYKDLGAPGWGYKMTMPSSGNVINEVYTGGTSGNPAELLTNMTSGKIRLQARTAETLADGGEHAYVFFLF